MNNSKDNNSHAMGWFFNSNNQSSSSLIENDELLPQPKPKEGSNSQSCNIEEL